MMSLDETDSHRILVAAGDEARYRQLAASAKRFGRIPDGMRVSFAYVRLDTGRMLEIILEPLPAWQTRMLEPLRVPRKLRDPSDVVVAVRDSESFTVQGEPRQRALRLLDALVSGARESGMQVEAVPAQPVRRNSYATGGPLRDEISFTVEHDEFRLWFTQATLRRPHEPTERELARARRGYMFPDFDDVPDEDLGIVLEGQGGRFWADSWKDAGDHRLEDDLAQILEEIRLRQANLVTQRAADAERQRQAEADRLDRERLRAEARERAVRAYREHQVDEAARDQARRWAEAAQLRGYAGAVRQHASSLESEDKAAALHWADRIMAVADAADPLPGDAVRPADFRAPTSDDLKPFMDM